MIEPKPDPETVKLAREQCAHGEAILTEEYLEEIRVRRLMKEYGLGPEDMEIDI